MLNFIDFKKSVKKNQLAVYPETLSNVGFYFSVDNSTGVELVLLRVAYYDNGCNCIFTNFTGGNLVTFDKAWEIYTKSLKGC